MSESFSTNPPQIQAIHGSTGTTPVVYGTILKYGINDLEGAIAGILIDSYSRSAKYASSEEIIGTDGRVAGLRMSDARVEISVSGRVLSTASAMLVVGNVLNINGDKSVITDVSMSAGSKEFVKVDIKSTGYEAISAIAPNVGGSFGS